MRNLLLFFLLLVVGNSHAQSPAETEIRRLDSAQKEAYFKKDTANFLTYFAEDVVVHGPSNKVETLPDLLARIRKGGSDREYYERIVEKVSFFDNIAVVMGNETTRPTGVAVNAGKTVHRRFTNVWMKRKTGWRLVARQSTIISVE